ncbi:hypothetical protein [Algisphaera agarilytica]|uniref:Oxidoreductase family, NAD-binding Rossmann fold n=1 Tax=Algisphaera agarilytica TaxID=1385975 RepID=A0A7X0LMC9_9BACT|nr:hypothetical protein [Algisphaera agarilytica]MBB6430893.1 hypothetical protein [Algisphaera agarilytica]
MTPPTSASLNAAEVTVWTSPDRANLAGELLDVMGGSVRPIGVGGPRSGELDDLGKRLGCAAGNDLRKLLIERPAASLLVTSLQGASIADLQSAAQDGTKVVCLEPLSVELDELGKLEGPALPESVTFAPSFLRSPGFLAAADPQESVHPPQLIRLTSLGRPPHGSLLARLLDAWTTALEFTPMPETISASLTGPTSPIRQITGQLAAHARVANGNTVLIEASDTAASTRRELSVLSDEAQLRVSDGAYELHQSDGNILDASDTPTEQPSFVDLLAHQWRLTLDRPAPAAAPQRQALACVHACLLSARTGQPESPSNLLQLSRA